MRRLYAAINSKALIVSRFCTLLRTGNEVPVSGTVLSNVLPASSFCPLSSSGAIFDCGSEPLFTSSM